MENVKQNKSQAVVGIKKDNTKQVNQGQLARAKGGILIRYGNSSVPSSWQ